MCVNNLLIEIRLYYKIFYCILILSNKKNTKMVIPRIIMLFGIIGHNNNVKMKIITVTVKIII